MTAFKTRNLRLGCIKQLLGLSYRCIVDQFQCEQVLNVVNRLQTNIELYVPGGGVDAPDHKNIW
jgi:hypothetical protein